mmetsp:Transcript_8461/g.25041  ORF Transcript_8461/g.25041 Transcript_8461/m.25041 type:complete len:464 (-) Transcript_8461:3224-4615(-)
MAAAATTIRLSETKSLDAEDLERLRRHASSVLEHLHNENESESCAPSPSWIGDGDSGNSSDGESESQTPSFQKRYFDANGFWVARGFCNADETQALKTAMTESVRLHWFPRGITKPSGDGGLGPDGDAEETELTTFGTDTKSNEARGDPFLESADKVSYFAEPTAIDSETGKLKPEFRDQHEETKEDCKKMLALCKAGHGLHLPPSFRRRRRAAADSTEANDGVGDDDEDRGSVHKPFFEYTTSSKLRELVLSLGYRDPVVPQSMYIFKNPVVGGAVHSHQDSTFLYTTPRQTCLGLWLALDDATLDNGCLWVRPKSHFEPVRRQFLRNPKHNENDTESESKLTFKQHHDSPSVTWEGTLPESVDVAPDIREVSPLNFIPVEVRAGDLVVFCGTLDHFSLPNFSDRQRHTFQLHLVEGPGAGVTWSRENWLQYGEPLGGDDAVNDAESDAEPESKFLRLLDYA